MTASQSQQKILIPALLLGGATITTAAAATAYYAYQLHLQITDRLKIQAEERRKEERTGRIRAEVKLRTLYKEKENLEMKLLMGGTTDGNDDNSNNNNNNNIMNMNMNDDNENLPTLSGASSAIQKNNNHNHKNQDQHKMILQCIGTVVSPYTKRMGTPRQGALVPSSRAFVDLNIPLEALDGMEEFSHVWIVFGFHANTNNAFHKKTKVRPPRADHKVGQLATRSPHRPNPLGLSLVKMERIDAKQKRLHISGIDLVHGTPVYDIKPCVPWDIPGYNITSSSSSSSSSGDTTTDDQNNTPDTTETTFRVPDWVDQKDAIATVNFTLEAEESLQTLVLDEKRLEPLYTKKNDGYEAARATLEEILAQDPRSSHKGLKTNQRGSSGSGSAKQTTAKDSSNKNDDDDTKMYNLVFGKMQVEFRVLSSGVQVESIVAVDFDEDAYVEGIPLISEQNHSKK